MRNILELILREADGKSGGTSAPSSAPSTPSSPAGPPASSTPAATPAASPTATPKAPATSSPSPAPQGAPITEPTTPPDFNALFEGSEDGIEISELELPASVTGDEPTVAAPPVAPTADAVVPAVPAAAAVTPPGPQDLSGAEAPTPLSPAEPADLAAAMKANESVLIEHLAQTKFKLTPEDVASLEANAVEFVPKMMARAFVESQHNTLNLMARAIPAMVARHLALTERNHGNESAFYSRWPELNKPEYKDTINRLAVNYRNTNPNVAKEQMIEEVGTMAMVIAKLQPTNGGPQGAAPSIQAPRPQHQPSPFRPAIGGVGAPPASRAPENPFEVLGMEEPE